MRKKSVILLLVIISTVIIALCITRNYDPSGSSLSAVVEVSCDRTSMDNIVKDVPDELEVCEDVERRGNIHGDALLNVTTPTQKETYLDPAGIKVSDSVNHPMSTSALRELNVSQARSMVAAHSSLRDRIVADPESEENKKVLQEMMFKAFASTSKNAAR